MLNAFVAALTGHHTLILPGGNIPQLTTAPPDSFDPAGTRRDAPALVVHTSGSTGQPKAVALSARALTASATATERLLAGPGQWLLALPHDHIAGAQVILRSLQAGTVPTVHQGKFTAQSFAEVTATIRSDLPLYVSLVPTQLVRIMDSATAREAARRFHTILLGGAAMSPHLLERAHDAGLNIVRTYGMSETGGGCVYNGVPFDNVTVSIDPDSRVRIAGPVLADGYVHVTWAGGAAQASGPEVAPTPSPPHLTALPAHPARTTHTADSPPPGFYAGPHGDTFLTSDLGRMDNGVLSILGRADDVFISGGINVSPLRVENVALTALEPAGVTELIATYVPDPEFGQRTVLLVVGTDLGHMSSDQLTALVKQRLAGTDLTPAEIPHRVWRVDALPLKGIGKPDRTAAAHLAMSLASTPTTHLSGG